MFKKSLSILLILSIIMICPLTAFAMTATPSDAMRVPVATSSNVILFQDYMESDDFDTLGAPVLVSSGDDITNTVDYGAVEYRLGYYDMNSVLRISRVTLDDDGYGSVSRPSDFASFAFLQIYLTPGALPTPGKYSMDLHFGSNTGGFTYNVVDLVSRKSYNNASLQVLTESAPITQSSGDISFRTTIDVGSGLYDLFLNITSVSGLYLPWGGFTSINFTRLSSNADVDYGTAGGPQTSDDIQGNIADNTAQQVEQGDTIIELIKNTIQTISSQLTAFWNQLAGEFTNLYAKMTQQHSEQLQADRDNTDDIIAAEESNTTNIINNNNANTDKLANGYDSSKLNESGNSLNNKLQEYESAESGINDTASGWLNDFTMPNFDNLVNTGGILSACIWLGSFWQTIFTDMGSFNIPVTLSFTLIFVLMLIGYHRFRR